MCRRRQIDLVLVWPLLQALRQALGLTFKSVGQSHDLDFPAGGFEAIIDRAAAPAAAADDGHT